MDKALVDGVLQLRNCLSLLLIPTGDCKSKGDKYFVDIAILVNGIFYKILKSGWFLDTGVLKKEVKNDTILGSHYTERATECHQHLKARLLQERTVQNQAMDMILMAVLRSIDSSPEYSEKRPTSFLLMGLTSFGRTELVEYFNNHFKIANGRLLLRIVLSDYMDLQSQLFPISHLENCVLSILEAVRRCPYSVLLFDHIEKANASV